MCFIKTTNSKQKKYKNFTKTHKKKFGKTKYAKNYIF